MLDIFYSLTKEEVKKLLPRSTHKTSEEVKSQVASIIEEVKQHKDSALYAYTKKFDNTELSSIIYPKEEINKASHKISSALKEAIGVAYENIYTFHSSQKPNHEVVEVMSGVSCWQKSLPIESVGLYIPGGTAPLFSTLLMLAIPAKLAGCEKIIVVTPPRIDGSVDPAILYTCLLLGLDTIATVGGAQAIAALCYGTESIPKVDKIFGPGNAYVTEAKQQVSQAGVAIDMPAGPSEVMVVIDENTNITFAASDILSQCEHGADSQAVLVIITPDKKVGESIAHAIKDEIGRQMKYLKRKNYIEQSLNNSYIVIVNNNEEAHEVINSYASEHLILNTDDYETLEKGVKHAGSVFLGAYSPESAGDYASGTNHTLPTSGYATAYSGITLMSFLKTITYQKLTQKGLQNLSTTIIEMANYETLDAHSNAVEVRIDNKRGENNGRI